MKNSIEPIFEDQNILVINKQSGIAVQSKSKDGSIEQILSTHYSHPLHIVHRIDQVISGLLLIAKNKKSAAYWSKMFAARMVQKQYLAIVSKKEIPNSGTLSAHLTHDRKNHISRIVTPAEHARKKNIPLSSLEYNVIGQLDNYQLLEIKMYGGKFHQIRAILSRHDLHIKGDVKYGARRKNLDRSICLHAYKLIIENKNSLQNREFVAPLPENNLWDACKRLINKKIISQNIE